MTIFQMGGAIIIGLGVGYVMQRPQICYNTAYRQSVFQGEHTMLRALVLAMLIQMVGFYALVSLGLVKMNVVPGIWLGALIGGLGFGLAFVFAEGCSTTMWYRVGNGNLGSLLALIGFAVGEVMTFGGPLEPLRAALVRPEIRTGDGSPATLPNLIGVSPWLLVIPLAVVGGWWLWCGRSARNDLGGWPWTITGIALGILGTAAWLVSQGTGWDYGIGVVGATGPILRSLWQRPPMLAWGSYLVLAMPIGGLIAAWQQGELIWKLPNFSSSARYVASGLAMGISASLAGGCNIGHTFTGMPTLAISSLIASAAIFAGAMIGNWLRFIKLGNPLPEVVQA